MDQLTDEQIVNKWNDAVAEHKYAEIDINLQSGIRRYVIERLRPGGLLCGILVNRWDAILHAHPSHTLRELQALTHFIRDAVPYEAQGSYEAIDRWCAASPKSTEVDDRSR